LKLLDDILKDILSEITPVLTITSVELVSGTTYKFMCENTYYLRERKTLTVGGDSYVVGDVVMNEYFTLLNGVEALLNVDSIALYIPKFKHGSPLMIQQDLSNMTDANKFPLAMVHQLITVNDFTSDWENVIDYEWDFTLFLLDVNHFEKWSVDEHEEKAIKPMYALLKEIKDTINADKEKFEEVKNIQVTNRINFGIYTNERGELRQLYTEKFSGIEVRIKLQYRKCDCAGVETPLPTTTLVKINDTNFANVVCGSEVDITVRNISGTEVGSNVDGVWVVPNGGDATVENSNASYTDTVASGGTLVLPDITVTDSDGSTSTVPSVTNVTCTPQIKTLNIVIPYAIGDDTSTVTIVANAVGTINTIDTTGLTTVAVTVNSTPVSVPFALALNDILEFTYDTTVATGIITLTGTYE
jgi:hypothetical protein